MLTRQVQRMLIDPRAESLSSRFASPWLRLQDLDKIMPDPIQYPLCDKTLADAFARETEMFFDSLVREDRSVLDLITADYTFVNQRVARHYGIPNVTGNEFRRVALSSRTPRHPRAGQHPDDDLESGSHVAGAARQVGLEVLLGPAAAAAAERAAAATPRKRRRAARCYRSASAWRNIARIRRVNRAIASSTRSGCRWRITDPTGKWRIKDGEPAVDASGVLYDGTVMEGPAGLARQSEARRRISPQLHAESHDYALGRRVEAADMPAVRRIVH